MKKLTSKLQNIDSSKVAVIFCVRNEKFRLPYFLTYYRNLGVSEFYAVDNNSNDGSLEYLLEQPDVCVFSTEASYKSSNAGKDWTSKIANEYCDQKWCLTLDVDEFFIYPYLEEIGINGLIEYLESRQYEGMVSIFLDFYSDKVLSQTKYNESESPFDVCDYFDESWSYKCYEIETFPFFEIKGGPRQRVFWEGSTLHEGPSMRKVPLIKWKKGFEYLVATHSCTPIRLADITAALAHFKLLSHFKNFSNEEVKRNDRVANSKDWKIYANRLEKDDVNFFDDKASVQFNNSKTLIKNSHIASSRKFEYFIEGLLLKCDNKNDKNKKIVGDFNKQKIITNDEPLNTVCFKDIVNLWGSFSRFSSYFNDDVSDKQSLMRLEYQVDKAIRSRLWRYSYRARKLASKYRLTDQRSLTEENYANQSLHSKFSFVYDSIWWDILGPLRVVEKILMRLGLLKRQI